MFVWDSITKFDCKVSNNELLFCFLVPSLSNYINTISNVTLLAVAAVNKAYKLFEDDEQVKYCEAIVEEARSQLETKVTTTFPHLSRKFDMELNLTANKFCEVHITKCDHLSRMLIVFTSNIDHSMLYKVC